MDPHLFSTTIVAFVFSCLGNLGATQHVPAFAPNFDRHPLPENTRAPLGGTVIIPCQVEAAPPPEVSWSKNGANMYLFPGDPGRVRMLLTNALVLSEVVSRDAGVYDCKASNEYGEAYNRTYVTVHADLNKRHIVSCSDGFYPAENRCQQCPVNCKRCRSQEQCLECVDGKFGDICDMDCSAECKTCEPFYSGARFARCVDCKPGLYGSMCMFNCSYCAGDQCSRDRCVNGCIDGWYEYQERMCVKCPSTCEECDPWSWSEQRCTSCPPTKWGNLCDKDCPSSCPSNNCDRHTGECACAARTYLDTENNACVACPENCYQCTSLTSCSTCKPGKKGPACQHDCVPHCVECKEGPGTDGRTYNPYHQVWELCSECEKGYHRNDRCYPCEEGCKDCWWMPRSAVEECNHCEEGYYKDLMVPNRNIMKCFRCPTGCKKCNKNGECQSCYEGYFRYDQTCCPENCNSCTSPESCTSCRPEYRGETCQIRW